MKSPRISIIVPVYKAESFLYKCVDSILSQTMADFELILVDDGSPDKSPEICDAYACRDARVTVIHQKNAGVSAARNRGIQEASGQYIGFVDSDDWITDDMYERMLTEAEASSADVVMCDALTVYENGETRADTIQMLHQNCMFSPEKMDPELMLEFAGAVWRCIYKRQLIQQNNIAFPMGLKFSEDRIFNIYAMGLADTICYVKQPLYMRYVNMESCVNSFHADHFFHAKLAARETEKAINMAWNGDEQYQRAYLKQFIDAACAAAQNIGNAGDILSLKERTNMMKEICNDPDLQNAFLDSGYFGECGKWIQKKRVVWLCCYNDRVKQKINNVKEQYAQAGMLGVVKKCISKLKR